MHDLRGRQDERLTHAPWHVKRRWQLVLWLLVGLPFMGLLAAGVTPEPYEWITVVGFAFGEIGLSALTLIAFVGANRLKQG